MKLQNKKFYSDKVDVDKYTGIQIKRCLCKIHKKREYSHYKACAAAFVNLVPDCSSMICLGVRNNHERDVFKLELKARNVDVYSLDIAPESGADYIMSFNTFEPEWENKWDIVFSNSIDHAIDATSTFYEWLRIVKRGGIMVVGFGLDKTEISATDCNTFTFEEVEAFIKSENDKFLYVGEINVSYHYYIIRKK